MAHYNITNIFPENVLFVKCLARKLSLLGSAEVATPNTIFLSPLINVALIIKSTFGVSKRTIYSFTTPYVRTGTTVLYVLPVLPVQ